MLQWGLALADFNRNEDLARTLGMGRIIERNKTDLHADSSCHLFDVRIVIRFITCSFQSLLPIFHAFP